MAYKVEEIEGIGPTFGKKLRDAGIASTDQLLAACAERAGCKAVAERTGLEEGKLLEWANRTDLMRVKGVGTQVADLLEAAGVDTVKELRTRNAASLARKLADINEAKRLAPSAPNEQRVAGWIEHARSLPSAIAS